MTWPANRYRYWSDSRSGERSASTRPRGMEGTVLKVVLSGVAVPVRAKVGARRHARALLGHDLAHRRVPAVVAVAESLRRRRPGAGCHVDGGDPVPVALCHPGPAALRAG